VEGHTKSTDDAIFLVLESIMFNFIDFETNLDLSFLHKNDFSELIKLLEDFGACIIKVGLKSQECSNHEVSVLVIDPCVEHSLDPFPDYVFPSADDITERLLSFLLDLEKVPELEHKGVENKVRK
jgi:hypothetical protein